MRRVRVPKLCRANACMRQKHTSRVATGKPAILPLPHSQDGRPKPVEATISARMVALLYEEPGRMDRPQANRVAIDRNGAKAAAHAQHKILTKLWSGTDALPITVVHDRACGTCHSMSTSTRRATCDNPRAAIAPERAPSTHLGDTNALGVLPLACGTGLKTPMLKPMRQPGARSQDAAKICRDVRRWSRRHGRLRHARNYGRKECASSSETTETRSASGHRMQPHRATRASLAPRQSLF